MTNTTKRGRAMLHDLSAARGVYEVDYLVHESSQIIKSIGKPSVTRTIITASIQSINGYILKNGKYGLEEDGKTLYQLEKSGALWRVI